MSIIATIFLKKKVVDRISLWSYHVEILIASDIYLGVEVVEGDVTMNFSDWFLSVFDRELNDSIEYEKLSIDIELYILSSHVKK